MERTRVRTNSTALLLGAAMRRLGVEALIFDAREMELLLEHDASIGSIETEDGAAAVLLSAEPTDT